MAIHTETAPVPTAPFVPGGAATVPPASVPLGFLAAAGAGLTGFGVAVWFAADWIVLAPTHPGAVSAVHVGMLAFLTTAVLGAVHQFAPVVARRPLRSVRVARLTLVGALYLACVALLPEFLLTGFRVAPIPFIGEQLDAILPTWFTQGAGVTFYFGGTSLLIVVGVAMDTVNQVESQLIMRHYDGFMKKTRIRGRRG